MLLGVTARIPGLLHNAQIYVNTRNIRQSRFWNFNGLGNIAEPNGWAAERCT
jgi:hypothetical protein